MFKCLVILVYKICLYPDLQKTPNIRDILDLMKDNVIEGIVSQTESDFIISSQD